MERRKRLRLHGYDYSSEGAYFVTICAATRGRVFGEVVDDVVWLNALGRLVDRSVRAIPEHHKDVAIDASIVMPDHVHVILVIGSRSSTQSLSSVVGSLKSRVTRLSGCRTWQRGFHDHVIRDDDDLTIRREYIETNPLRWSLRRSG